MIASTRVMIGGLVASTLSLGACIAQPTTPSIGDPAFTGYTYGSGNHTQDTTTTATSTVAADTTGRGDYTYGSGN